MIVSITSIMDTVKKTCSGSSFALLALLLTSCSLLSPRSSDELESITLDVLKKNEGVDIQIKPIKEK